MILEFRIALKQSSEFKLSDFMRNTKLEVLGSRHYYGFAKSKKYELGVPQTRSDKKIVIKKCPCHEPLATILQ